MTSKPTRRAFLRGAAAAGASWLLLGDAARSETLEPDGEWLAGDLHCHTSFSRDVLAASEAVLSDEPDAALRVGMSPGEQIASAVARGLDFLAITDHDTTRALTDPGYRSDRLVLVPGYEHSLASGHAGALGVRAVVPGIDRDDPADARRLRDAVHRAGGLLIPTHPYDDRKPWRPRIAIRPDALELWNGHWSDAHVRDAVRRWQREWLSRARVPAVGGSDHHFREWQMHNGVGQPTTWVRTKERSWQAVLAGIRAGRTSVSFGPPALGGPLLLLEAEQGGAPAGPGSTIRDRTTRITARVAETAASGQVSLVVDGHRLERMSIVGPVGARSWEVRPERFVRAELRAGKEQRLLAFTSPIWVA